MLNTLLISKAIAREHCGGLGLLKLLAICLEQCVCSNLLMRDNWNVFLLLQQQCFKQMVCGTEFKNSQQKTHL